MTNATKTKRNARIARTAVATKPAIKVIASKLVTPALHALIVFDCELLLDGQAIARENYDAFCAVHCAIKWASREHVTAVCEDIRETMGDVDFSGCNKRLNIINNAFKVAHGGTVGDKMVQGIGINAMLDILTQYDGINALQKAMADAKPEAMKDTRGGARTDATPEATKAKQRAVNVPLTQKTAFEAACNVLEAAEKFLKPSDHVLISAIDSLVDMLQERMAS